MSFPLWLAAGLFAFWVLVAVLYSNRLGRLGLLVTEGDRRRWPITAIGVGIALAAGVTAFLAWRAADWIGLLFVALCWAGLAVPEVRRLGLALPGGATAVLAVAYGFEMWIPRSGDDFLPMAAAALASVVVVVVVVRDRRIPQEAIEQFAMNSQMNCDSFSLFDGLTLMLGNRLVLADQSLGVKPGEIVVIMGPSGVGKSVLADVTFGLRTRADTLYIDGEVGSAKACGALVFQEGGGLPHLSVEENLRLISSDAERFKALANRFQLDLRQSASTLSGGERRRLAVARALLASRRVLWLDEPEAGLDIQRVGNLAQMLVAEARTDGLALIVTTHNTSFAKLIADRVLFMDGEGQLLSLSSGQGHEDLSDLLADHLAAAETTGSAEKARAKDLVIQSRGSGRTGFGWMRGLSDWLLSIPQSVPFLPVLLWFRYARTTMVRALALSGGRGAVFYPFIGAVFGAVFVVTFHIVAQNFVVSAAKVIEEFGPELALRFVPPVAAILVAAAGGSTIASWIGDMSVGRHLDSLEVLGVRTQRWVLAPAWWGFFLASVTSTLTFGLALSCVFVGYIYHSREAGLFFPTLVGFLGDLWANPQCVPAFAKAVVYGLFVSSVTVGCASADHRSPSEAAAGITRGIVWSSVIIMTIELVTVSWGLVR